MTREYEFAPIEDVPGSQTAPLSAADFQVSVQADVGKLFRKYLAEGKEGGFNIDYTMLGAACSENNPGRYGFIQDPATKTWYGWAAYTANDRTPTWLWFENEAKLRLEIEKDVPGYAALTHNLLAGIEARQSGAAAPQARPEPEPPASAVATTASGALSSSFNTPLNLPVIRQGLSDLASRLKLANLAT